MYANLWQLFVKVENIMNSIIKKIGWIIRWCLENVFDTVDMYAEAWNEFKLWLLKIPFISKLSLKMQKMLVYQIFIVPHVKLAGFYLSLIKGLFRYFRKICFLPKKRIISIFIIFVFINVCWLPYDLMKEVNTFAIDLWMTTSTLKDISLYYIFSLTDSNLWVIKTTTWCVLDFFFLLCYHLLPLLHKWYTVYMQKIADSKKGRT